MTTLWPQRDGSPIACREKLRVLAENEAELASMLRDVFDDAVLMGVDETAMRRILIETIEALPSPLQARGSAGTDPP
ncbi:hypothetical protein [Lichenicola sp.]|uniref:hypothetical protein n=1 Tax=Lichenicola sp. TaxID=2804529 RepID=UPI003AFF762A